MIGAGTEAGLHKRLLALDRAFMSSKAPCGSSFIPGRINELASPSLNALALMLSELAMSLIAVGVPGATPY